MSLPNLRAKKTIRIPSKFISPTTSAAAMHFPNINKGLVDAINRIKGNEHKPATPMESNSDLYSLCGEEDSISSLDDSNVEVDLKKFAMSFKKQQRLNDRNCTKSTQQRENGALAYINSASALSLLPRPAGMVKWKENEINLQSHCLGDNYASALSKGIKSLNKLEVLNLNCNRLSNKGAMGILSTIPENVRVLDFANNKDVSYPTIQMLGELLSNPVKKYNAKQNSATIHRKYTML